MRSHTPARGQSPRDRRRPRVGHLLAATTEYACETVGIAPPAWCKAEAFRGPDEQWYAEEETERALGLDGGDIEKEMRERHLAGTPECFRRRNLVINPESLNLLRGG